MGKNKFEHLATYEDVYSKLKNILNEFLSKHKPYNVQRYVS